MFSGYVVLLDTADPAARNNPALWSDVVAFTTSGPVTPGQPTDHVFMISDTPDATGIEHGITPADLAVAGLSIADILGNPTTVFMVEGQNPLNTSENDYVVAIGTATVTYRIFSDPPEGPTPTKPGTWGRIKTLYR